MQPAASALEGVKSVKGELGEAVLNEMAFLRKRAGDVPIDQPASVSHKAPGEHDIDNPLTFPENGHIVIHDSRGFEA
ncbi:hypothetical protein GALMADRAFT_779008 [Galerina marginata CBS 339.88]|uniref:Uncharacterized protein n=1 Tax=Galerina marginata (strain CBS 339.88) TaxID=685588 RepID=A0A067SLI7_GALM3|nr:hypothetical protein GALMADRAFT_779008 [Galerina marginata CBS 339.88]